MAHFAKLNNENIVTDVYVVDNVNLLDENGVEKEEIGINYLHSLEGSQNHYVQCSYTGKIRKRYPGIGYYYDEVKDAFIAPKPFDSWLLNEDLNWEAPVAEPSYDELTQYVLWNESKGSWDIVNKEPRN